MTQPGLQDLPPELLREIISYIPDLPFPFTPRPFPKSNPFLKEPLSTDEPRVQKTSTLRSLSQTCRPLREFARPLAWEVIEVVSVKKEDAEEKRRLATKTWKSQLGYGNQFEYALQLERELWRQLRVVLEEEELRKNLRRVSVIITDSSAQAALEMFKAFSTFPKLHTIQLLSLSDEFPILRHKDLLSSLCNLDTPLRSVKNVVLPDYGKGLLRHCPALEALVATLGLFDHHIEKHMLADIFDHCPSVRFLQGFTMYWPIDVEPLVKGCPQLSYLCFDHGDVFYDYDESEKEHQAWKRVFQELSALQQLRHITLVVDVSGPFEIPLRHQSFIMHCIMLLGGVSGANLEEYLENEDITNPFTSPFPTALLPLWFLKKIISREVASDQMNVMSQDRGSARTLTVDIDGIKRPVAILSVAPPAEGDTWPRLLGMRVGYRSNEAFEELYDLIDIPLNIDRQPDPSTNVDLARPQVFYNYPDSDECDFPGPAGALFL